jgi:hypothetical protein
MDEARLRQQAIGVRLRQMFDEVVNEQVPEEFLEILRRADSRSSEGRCSIMASALRSRGGRPLLGSLSPLTVPQSPGFHV